MLNSEGVNMKRQVAIGVQDFEKLRKNKFFYVDKSSFIKEWWDSGDDVTLITRPRRFGKTLNMSMLNCFFSNEYAGRGDLFEGLDIWKYEKFRDLQGAYPVIFLSFAGVKGKTYEDARKLIKGLISNLYDQYEWMLKDDLYSERSRKMFYEVENDMSDSVSVLSLNRLCEWLYRYYGKKCIVLLDEYDTPLQEAYVNKYWDEMVNFIRTLFNNTFKTNPSLERGIMTGITRVSKESIFSDLNNLAVVSTTSDIYTTAFGFTEKEVFTAMDEQEMPEADKAGVKKWYDGFTFGKVTDIYNPWSITMYLKEGKLGAHWANTSSNGLVGELLKTGNPDIKIKFEELLNGGNIRAAIDEQIIFNQLGKKPDAVWSLLLASGYLKVTDYESYRDIRPGSRPVYTLTLTNFEVKYMFESLIIEWFSEDDSLGRFASAMLAGNVLDMNRYMNDVALATFSSFDTGNKPSNKQPEKFYHGFVLGLLVENAGDYALRSNRESGYGRYDVVMEPRDKAKPAVIMEFKVIAKDEGEETLQDTARSALEQIEAKKYDSELIANGVPEGNILKYGIVFEGKKCLIVKG